MLESGPPTVTMPDLMERHEVLLLDAYGVLIHHTGALPHAAALLDRLNSGGVPYFIVTNDASRLPATTAARLAGMGLTVSAERIISSGTMLGHYFQEHGLHGARCAVLGTADSLELVRLAGGEVVPPGQDAPVLVVCDEAGFDFIQVLDDTVSMLLTRLDRGAPVRLVLPNPDLIYPKTEHGYGITAGSMALLIEGILSQRYPGQPGLLFERLGKPNPPIFQAALARAGVTTRQVVMVGDQPSTDIRGANAAGIPSALVSTGLHKRAVAELSSQEQPTYLLSSLRL